MAARSRRIADFRTDIAGRQRRRAVRRQRQHGRPACRTRARPRPTCSAGWTGRDEAAVFTFDTHLDERVPFTTGLKSLPDVDGPGRCRSARRRCTTRSRATAKRVGEREGRRRAVVVLTDGADNCEQALAVGRVAASRARSTCRSTSSASRRRSTTPRKKPRPSRWRGRRSPVRSRISPPGPADTCSWRARRDNAASRRGRSSTSCGISICIAFESSGTPGWHPLVVRARNKDLTVRARSGYIAGQSSPTAN